MSDIAFFPGFDQFATNFVRHENLSADFNKRKPVGPATGKALWFERPYTDIPGSKSINDILRDYLRENGYEYINDYFGTVWFLYQGNWHSCQNEVKDGFIRFFMLEYDLG